MAQDGPRNTRKTSLLSLVKNLIISQSSLISSNPQEAYFKSEDYTIEAAKRVCGDVAGLQAWTQAMADFYTINKEVLPLKANLFIQEGKLGGAMAELAVAQEKLDAKQAELDEVQAIYDGAMAKKQVGLFAPLQSYYQPIRLRLFWDF